MIHYIVNPLPYGSYENNDLLKRAIEIGFKHDIPDKTDKTPYQYALLQKSGIMKLSFEHLIPDIIEQSKQHENE